MRMCFSITAALFAVLCSANAAFPCSRESPVSVVDMVRDAGAIVRALATEYAVRPTNPSIVTTDEPDSKVRFKVLEVIRGKDVGPELVLPGYLSDRDDFTDDPTPYTFVRPNGRSGSCFANSYRSGAQFLLLLKKRSSGEYTVNWYALGPVNEQLRSETDPWLLWVRQQANGALPNNPLQPTTARTRSADSGFNSRRSRLSGMTLGGCDLDYQHASHDASSVGGGSGVLRRRLVRQQSSRNGDGMRQSGGLHSARRQARPLHLNRFGGRLSVISTRRLPRMKPRSPKVCWRRLFRS
jgi:hypothetical protein